MIAFPSTSGLFRALAFLLGLLPGLAARGEMTTLETIELRYRTAAEVLPVVEPVVRGQGTVTGSGNLLVLRTTPSNLAEVRRVLETIDTRPRRLRVTALQNVDRATRDRLLAAGGRVSPGDVALEMPFPQQGRGANLELGSGEDSLGSRAREGENGDRDWVAQQVLSVEGSPVFIMTGELRPGAGRRVSPTPYGGRLAENAGSRALATGFFVLPRVSGASVTLELSFRRDQAGPRETADLARASTVLSGRLGEWIDAGSVAWGRQGWAAGPGFAGESGGSGEGTLLLRVEEVR
jgi:hypothetical protein